MRWCACSARARSSVRAQQAVRKRKQRAWCARACACGVRVVRVRAARVRAVRARRATWKGRHLIYEIGRVRRTPEYAQAALSQPVSLRFAAAISAIFERRPAVEDVV